MFDKVICSEDLTKFGFLQKYKRYLTFCKFTVFSHPTLRRANSQVSNVLVNTINGKQLSQLLINNIYDENFLLN